MSTFNVFVVIISSLFGMAYFAYGKKQQKLLTMIAGGLLMFLPYFITNPWITLLIGGGLVAVPFLW